MDEELQCLNINDAINFMYKQFGDAIAGFVPIYAVRSSIYPAWFTKELICLVRAKKAAHYKFKTNNSFTDYVIFSNLRVKCKAFNSRCWREYVLRSELAISDNVGIF